MPATVSLPAFGSTATLCVADEQALLGALSVLEGELAVVDLACSRFRPDSELVRLNESEGRPVRVSERLFEAIQVSLRAAELTGGLVDPTVGGPLRLAGYDETLMVVRRRAGSREPEFAPAPGWRSVKLDEQRREVRVLRGAELDLGATAKALAADRAARLANEATGAGVLVSLGGDVAVAGPAPAGGWPIRIADDHAADRSSPGPTISVSSGGVATSSTTVRRWRMSGGELHHILDPRTGRPGESPWRTVSVAAATCVDANVASTAALLLGDRATSWLADRRLPARLVSAEGTSLCVAGWPEDAC
ncbi:MAG: FAD:protein FMN transferase [Gaiellaceae bacterium]